MILNDLFQSVHDAVTSRIINPLRQRFERERDEEWQHMKKTAAARMGNITQPTDKAVSVNELARRAEVARRAKIGEDIARAHERGEAERKLAAERLRAHGRTPQRTQPKVNTGIGRNPAATFNPAATLAAYHQDRSRL